MNRVSLHNLAPAGSAAREEVIRGLRSPQKELPCKLFYDEIGSQFFEQICALDEYYPTRAELRIMRASAAQMADRVGPESVVIEYGSGSSTKTPLLLDRLERPVAYIPIDISREVLEESAAAIAARYPDLEVLPVCADYTRGVRLPTTRRPPARRVAYYPGSTLGNFVPEAAKRFLATDRRGVRARRRPPDRRRPEERPAHAPPRLQRRAGHHRRVQPQYPAAAESRARGRFRPRPLPPLRLL